MNEPRFFSVSEFAICVSFENRISEKISQKIFDLAEYIEKNPLAGMTEIVPAFSSLTLFYDPFIVGKNFPNFPTAFEAAKFYLQNALQNLSANEEKKPRSIEIFFDTSDEYALDLEFISETKSLSKTEIIEIFTSKIYRVFMLGFLPGFAYMGETDERIAVPRKETPRLKVPKGSVGIAGNQTGIYSFDSPGGWQIIGRTETEMFTPQAKNPTFLRAGDLVKFIAK